MTHNRTTAAATPQDPAVASHRPNRSAKSPRSTKPATARKQSGQAPKSQPRRTPSDRTRPAADLVGNPNAELPGERVSIGSPAALLAVVPALLGFAPDQSIVVIGTESPRARVRVTLRYDLPDQHDPRAAAALAGHAISVLSAQAITTAVAVGYGPDTAVSPVIRQLRERASEAGIAMTELLRVEERRYWSYICADPGCCPPEGTAFDISDHPVARALTAESRVLASRDELVASVATADGELAETMRRATRETEEQVDGCVARLRRAGLRVSARRLIAVLGPVAVRDAISRYRVGEPIGTQYAAWVSVALRELRVRDDAWARMLPEHGAAHQRLWTDLTRLARPGYVSAPASLLAFVAWQSGNGALANVALDRALADNRRYSMALLLRRILDSGAPPALARLPMTPEEVAASYNAMDAEGGSPRR